MWYLTQMRRWGQITEAKTDEWYHQTAKDVYRPEIYAEAARKLIAEGHMQKADFPDLAAESGFRAATADFIDGVQYDGREPNAYLRRLQIGKKD